LKVEGLYVILYLCVEPTTTSQHEEVAHANSLPEKARLKVEGLYVILYLCVESATTSQHEEMNTMNNKSRKLR
jgi:hypothetical protein